ncbi:MAG: PEP-CTERM sorting domain-containing protein [Planctomycetota bacterium]
MTPRNLSRYAVVLVVLLAFAPLPLAAAELATLAQVQWGDNPLAPVGGSSVPGTDIAENMDSFSDEGASFIGSASAFAEYGRVGVLADANANNSPYLFNAAVGQAGFTDALTITGGTPGTPGTITFTVQVDGSATTTGDGQVLADVVLVQGDLLTGDLDGVFQFADGGFSFTSKEFNFIYDQPFDFTVTLGVNASVNGSILDPPPHSVTGSAVGSFENTVTLTGMAVYEGGVPVTSFAVQSQSGTAYPIPEPSTLALLGAALAGWALARLRSRR